MTVGVLALRDRVGKMSEANFINKSGNADIFASWIFNPRGFFNTKKRTLDKINHERSEF